MLTAFAIALLSCGTNGDNLAIAPPPRVKYVRPTDYVGEVMAVTDKSITIRGRDQCDKDG